jgi:hypothetical protein
MLSSEKLMRQPQALSHTPQGVDSRLRLIAVAALAGVLSACSATGGKQNADILGDTPDEVNWTGLKNAELEAENEKLRTENEALTKRVAELEKAATPPAETAPAASEAPGPTALQTPPKTQTVVSPVKVDEAFKGSPAPPVDPAPRLVQPSFASGEETVFENEASGAIKTSSVLYGVHLASYTKSADAAKGWRKLQRENPDQLGLLEPRVVSVTVDGRKFVRLIGGGFSSEEKATQLCESLKTRGVFCTVTGFEGERLSFSEG